MKLADLKNIAFALMLGAGIVITALSVWMIAVLAHAPWPDAVAEHRIHGLAVALWITLGVEGLIVIALAFGKLDSLKFGNHMANVELDFEDGEDSDRRGRRRDDC